MIETVHAATALAKALKVVGLMNIQYAIKDDELFIIEVNPRASRTVPFVSKAIGISLAKLAARVMAGKTKISTLLKKSFLRTMRLDISFQPIPRFANYA